jgi:hypothetical protein
MNKIKNFISDNKRGINKFAYGAAMLAVGFYVGIKAEETMIGVGLERLAKSGKILNTVIDNEIYVMSIVKQQINKD